MTALSPRDGYRLWAPVYDTETVVSALDGEVVMQLAVSTSGRRLLDAGCGVGRRVRATDASLVVGVDLSDAMLERATGLTARCVGDVRALPLGVGRFDVVWCRLVLGHLPEIGLAYAELARVCAPAGAIIVTDFHPAAAAAGHRRTFRDLGGTMHEIAHHRHEAQAHVAAARDAGLDVVRQLDGVVGESVRPYYEHASRRDAYDAQVGLPLVLALHLQHSA